MTVITTVRQSLTALVASTLFSTCFAADLGITDAPQWVYTGTAYETIQGKRLFQGVGSAPVMGDDTLQTSTSEGRARRELQRILRRYLNDLADEYRTTAPPEATSTPEGKAAAQLAALGEPALRQAKVVARWRDPRTGLLYTLIQLDLGALKQIAANSTAISAETRKFVKEYSDIVFDSESQYVEY